MGLLAAPSAWAQEVDPKVEVSALRKSAKELDAEKLTDLAAAYADAFDDEQDDAKKKALEERLTMLFKLMDGRDLFGPDAKGDKAQIKKRADVLAALGEKERLGKWADAYLKRVKALDAAIKQLGEQHSKAADGDKPAIEEKIAGQKEELDAVAGHARALVSALKAVGLGDQADELTEFLVMATGKVALEDLSIGALAKLIGKLLTNLKEWAVNKGPGILFQILIALLILFVFKRLSRWAGRLTHAALARSKIDLSSLLRGFFEVTVRKLVYFIGILIALRQLGVDIGPVLAGLGVTGLIIGFALQGTLSNFASGMMIMTYRPFDIGHVINAAGVLGKVDSMTLVSTTIVTPDNQVIVVPNNSIWNNVITNITARKTRRVDLTIGVGYGDDLDKAQQVLMDEVKKHDKVLEDPEPVVKVSNLGDSSVDFIVRPWSRTDDYWDVYWDLHKSIKQRLDAEGLNIPFPQRDVHLFTQPVAEAAPPALAGGAPNAADKPTGIVADEEDAS